MAGSADVVFLSEEDSHDDERTQRVAKRWVRLLLRYWGIRKLQLYVGSIGTALRVNFTASARDRVADIYKK